jgi:hypothetical protein
MNSRKLSQMQTFSFYIEWEDGKRKGTTEIVNISATTKSKALELLKERYEDESVNIIDRSMLH